MSTYRIKLDREFTLVSTNGEFFHSLGAWEREKFEEKKVALRLKSHWWNPEQARSVPEIAGALAFIAWRLAIEKAINLHCERFVYENDEQRMAVIQEYLVFLIQIADRLSFEIMDEDDRRTLITTLAAKVIGHIQDNGQDLFGAGDYGRPFIALLDRRSEEYAQFRLDDEGPSYPFLRHLGYEIQCVMGQQAENRWVIDQVMDKDGQEAYRQFAGAFGNLFDQTTKVTKATKRQE